MKHLIYFFTLLILASGCASSEKLMQRSQYDMAIAKSVKKLKKKPSKAKQIAVLKESYRIANQQNNDRIDFLRKSGQPDIWDEIYINYNAMKNRQNTVGTLPVSVLNQIDFVKKNYDEEIIGAKKKAADFYYAHGVSLLNKKDKMSAREAYGDFVRVKELYATYKDIDKMIEQAHAMGVNHVIFELKNNSRTFLPKDFEAELLKISLKDLNGLWINYDTYRNTSIDYDYSIIMNIKEILVSPESVEKNKFTEEKEIEDGFKYKYDAKGNVMKDTAGNDIKIPVIKVITCMVYETHQYKTAVLNGTLDFYNNESGQIIKTDPITAKSIFEHHAAEAVGNIHALKPETKKRIGKTPLPFPTDPAMVMEAGETLKGMCKDIIFSNKGILLN